MTIAIAAQHEQKCTHCHYQATDHTPHPLRNQTQNKIHCHLRYHALEHRNSRAKAFWFILLSLLQKPSGHTQVLKQEPTRKGMGNLGPTGWDSRSIPLSPAVWLYLLGRARRHNLTWTRHSTRQYGTGTPWSGTPRAPTVSCWSQVSHSALEVQEAFIDVDTSEVWETGPVQSTVHLSYWLPSNTLEGDKGTSDSGNLTVLLLRHPRVRVHTTNVVGAARGEFIFEELCTPWLRVRASSRVSALEESSRTLSDYRGAGEGWAYIATVEWLGTQNWSNGNVGLYGKSLRGSHPMGG